MTGYDLLVIFMVLCALAYVTRVFFKRLKKEEPGCCGCSACGMDPASCGEGGKTQGKTVERT